MKRKHQDPVARKARKAARARERSIQGDMAGAKYLEERLEKLGTCDPNERINRLLRDLSSAHTPFRDETEVFFNERPPHILDDTQRKRVIYAVTDCPENDARAAIEIAGMAGDPAMARFLFETAQKTRSSKLRVSAFFALAEMARKNRGHEELKKLVVDIQGCLNDKDERIRFFAAQAIAYSMHETSKKILEEYMEKLETIASNKMQIGRIIRELGATKMREGSHG